MNRFLSKEGLKDREWYLHKGKPPAWHLAYFSHIDKSDQWLVFGFTGTAPGKWLG
jgi:hypothetical protein